MSESTSSGNSVAVTLEEENPSFLNDSIELKKVLKDLSKHTRAAIEVLVTAMNDPKSSVDVKMRAATKLLEFHSEAAKEVNKDQMQRIIAEIKLNRDSKKRLIPVGDDSPQDKIPGPIVDFTTIREVE